jgi:hypothetical protein
MGRPIGSVNREKPFTDMLRVAPLSGGAAVCVKASAGHRAPRRPTYQTVERPRTVREHPARLTGSA